jgi:ketosteroid isomerase-like protein
MFAPHRRRRRPALTCIALVLGLLATAPAATAEDAAISAADRAAIRRVIGAQLDAFKRHDARDAFAHAAPAIQELFGTPETFMVMVRREYPPIYRPRSFTFGDLEVVAGELTQQVTIVGEDGNAAAAFYLMARQGDGSWRVLGCILVPIEKTVI